MALYLLVWCSFFFCVDILAVAATESWSVDAKICHSCAKGGTSTTCFCDNMCTLYNDCCYDAPVATTRFQSISEVRFSCFQLFPIGDIYLISECMKQWHGSNTVRSKCESQNDFTDLSMIVPVTDMYTNITYLNLYCAECNRVSLRNLFAFSLSVSCSPELGDVNNMYGNITNDFLIQNIINLNGSWGVYHWDEVSGNMVFFYCSVYDQLPESLSYAVRSCNINTVSTCPDDWTDEFVRRQCMSSNMHIVYDSDGTRYRNMHCALCNYIPENTIRCTSPWGGGYGGYGGGHGGYGRPNFKAFLNFWNVCGVREVHDEDSNKCRRMVCPDTKKEPFYGKCIEKGN